MSETEALHSSEVPSKSELIERLIPGGWSKLGFLSADESLDDVMTRDAATLERLNLSYDAIATALYEVLTTALAIWNKPVSDEDFDAFLASETDFPNLYEPQTLPKFDLNNLPDTRLGVLIGDIQVFIMVYKGWQDCPWGCNVRGSCDFMLLNRRTGEWVTAPELMPHLIKVHHFFEGLGTPFRTDPEQLAKVLELKSPSSD